MIIKQEIKNIARVTNLSPHVIEKNYVLSWILAGIYNNKILSDTWIFKGGTCIKKCYFETYRFSEDLDFTLLDKNHLDVGILHSLFTDIANWVNERSGIKLTVSKEAFEIHKPQSAQGKISYHGPLTSGSGDLPKIKFDLTIDEELCLSAVKREVFHPYSDRPQNGIHIMCYRYEEIFAEKIRALSQRANPRDLYDVVNLYRHEKKVDTQLLKNTLLKKCEAKDMNLPTMGDIYNKNKDDLNLRWRGMLGHQLSYLPSVESYWEELTCFFEWLNDPELTSEKLPSIPIDSSQVLFKEPIFKFDLNPKTKSLIELIRFASTNYLCVKINYHHESGDSFFETIEAYALSKKEDIHLILYAWNIEKQEVATYLTTRIKSLEMIDEHFIPRYKIDIIPNLIGKESD